MNQTDKFDTTLAFLDDLNPEGWWDWHLKEDWEYISPKYWEFLGYDPATKRHHPSEWQAIINPDDAKAWLEEYNKHIASKGKSPSSVSKIVRYTKADGGIAYVVFQGKVIEWDTDGSPVRMIGTHTDVTKSVLDSKKILKQEEIFHVAFYRSMHPASIISLQGYFTGVNQSFIDLLGFSQEELKKKTWMDITHPEDLERCSLVMGKLISGEISFMEQEKRYISKNGKTIPVKVHIEIIRNGSPYFMCHVKDLSLEKELLEAIKKIDGIG